MSRSKDEILKVNNSLFGITVQTWELMINLAME